jgi:hypothetical protein
MLRDGSRDICIEIHQALVIRIAKKYSLESGSITDSNSKLLVADSQSEHNFLQFPAVQVHTTTNISVCNYDFNEHLANQHYSKFPY